MVLGVILAHIFFNLPLAIRILLQALNNVPGEHYRLISSLKLSFVQSSCLGLACPEKSLPEFGRLYLQFVFPVSL